MATTPDVLCAGIIVADHVCTPIPHVPAAGELVTLARRSSWDDQFAKVEQILLEAAGAKSRA